MKEIALYLMSLFYLAAGIMHFMKPGIYMKIMPPYLPFHLPLVYISGILEIASALLLLNPWTRTYGAWLTVVLLIMVFPANVQMAINFYQRQNPYFWATLVRLPVQLLLIWWAWLYTR